MVGKNEGVTVACTNSNLCATHIHTQSKESVGLFHSFCKCEMKYDILPYSYRFSVFYRSTFGISMSRKTMHVDCTT